MITRDEIEAKAAEFDIHAANVERDYVFGWLLWGIYNASTLKDTLILKGGNAFRKAYFPNTRFSNDLDFSTETQVVEQTLRAELDRVCDFVHEATGITFENEKKRVDAEPTARGEGTQFKIRLYFKDFYGNPGTITISVRLDITEFDRLYLPTQIRQLIHPYSDNPACQAQVRCIKLEEMLASKLKCLLQRRHSFDLYDYVYAVFFNNELAVNRTEILSTFFRKTIFERSPGAARGLLLGLPVATFKAAWDKYIVCPRQSVISFESAFERFCESVRELFAENVFPDVGRIFYPADMRNLILEAGSGLRLMTLTYDGIRRAVEPYSLAYKRRKDGHAEEYFYAWDRVGGASGPGIKAFLNAKVSDLAVLEETFQPRYEVELAKAGEPARSGYFAGRPFGGTRFSSTTGARRSAEYHGTIYIVQCTYCGKEFKRRTRTTMLKEHNDGYGNRCYGRHGTVTSQEYV
jgi:predicted nucleotidyltransferase component of viral defense system